MTEYIKKVKKDFLKKKKEKFLKNKKEDKFTLAKSLNIGYYLITPLFLGIFLGIWLDKMFQTKPVFLLFFLFVGIIGSFYNLWKITKEF